MKYRSLFKMRPPLLIGFLTALLSPVTATRLIESSTLDVLETGNFSVAHFTARFTPNNRTLALDLLGETAITGYVTAEVVIVIYGYETNSQTVDPCNIDGLDGFCPMQSGALDLDTEFQVPADVLGNIPGIGYSVPDLDASIRIAVNQRETGIPITTIEAILANNKTVYQAGAGWTIAVIAGLGLAASVYVSIRGSPIASAQLTAYTLALFSFVQSQAMIGMLAVPMPPMVRSWTQNLQWSMGVVHAGFLETICTWYLRSTGGTPATLLSDLSDTMVHVMKKRDQSIGNMFVKRAESETEPSATIPVRGLSRVAFRAHIDQTNLFLTSMIIFGFIAFVVMVLLATWKAVLIILAKKGRTSPTQWNLIAKGIFYRLFLLAFAPVCILCLWEFTQHDSPAEIIIAVLTFLSISGTIVWATVRLLLLTRQAVPGYMLFSDQTALHKYGFLYLPYKPTSSFFIAITLAHLLVKSLFISFAQSSPKTQTIAFFIIESAMLLTVSILRPYHDKKTNAYNITIAAINFLNSIFVLFFSGIFNQPKLVSGVMGVILFVVGAALTLILLVLVLVYAIWTVFFGKQDGLYMYRPSLQDGSPMQSSTGLTSKELEDLAATARGEGKRDEGFFT
ncbi:hypothetical protein BDW59DRAFT_140887 [Aspergillus cavernicola]|uniref:ML-like domain-containing protein n=1 Tax=Aspergillus cavernicola TaxID=176166 RepID=A0ABR4IST9_9EURO